MSVAAEIESLFTRVRTMIGALPAEVDAFFAAHLEKVKTQEAQETQVQAEIDHLHSLGYSVNKTPSGDDPQAQAAEAQTSSDPTALLATS